jgi:hypothetical protein
MSELDVSKISINSDITDSLIKHLSVKTVE